MTEASFTPLMNVNGKEIGPLPIARQGWESASNRLGAVSFPDPIRVIVEDILFNNVTGRKSKSQRVPLANAKNMAESQATILLRVSLSAINAVRKMASVSVS